MNTNPLIQLFASFNLLSEAEIAEAFEHAELRTLHKGEFFIKEGEVCNEVAVISKGLFRSFYYNSNLEEVTYCFRYENNFLSAYSSFLTGLPSTESFEALTDVEFYVWPKSWVEAIEKKSINWVRFFKRLTELEYLEMEQHIFILQKENAEQRYQHLMDQFPHYLQRIPLNYLASYLGITQRHLSRIRKGISL